MREAKSVGWVTGALFEPHGQMKRKNKYSDKKKFTCAASSSPICTAQEEPSSTSAFRSAAPKPEELDPVETPFALGAVEEGGLDPLW